MHSMDLSYLDSSLLVPHPYRTLTPETEQLRVWDPCPIWSINFGYFDRNRWGKVWTILMIYVINTKAKVKFKKMKYLLYRNFYVAPFPLISFRKSPQVLHIISHNLGFIALYLYIIIILRRITAPVFIHRSIFPNLKN